MIELPHELKTLYRHWPQHVSLKPQADLYGVVQDKMLADDIVEFVQERMCIWQKKYHGAQPPYTNDAILATYRFCNVLRELDKQTIEYHTLLNPLRDNFPLWLLNMFYCRMVARPETVHNGGLLSFDKIENEKLYKQLLASPRPRYGTPYVFPVSVIMRSETPTRELFITRYLPSVMKHIATEIETWQSCSVGDGVDKIIHLFGFNLFFLWTEVLIDVAYQFPEKVNLFGRFPIGPGALPTFKKIDAGIDPECLIEKLAKIYFRSGLTFENVPIILSAENWEGVGCEYRKYTNLKEGRGRRRLFVK